MGGFLLLQMHLLTKGDTTLEGDNVRPTRHYFFGPDGEFLGRGDVSPSLAAERAKPATTNGVSKAS